MATDETERKKFLNGLKKYPEMGVSVYIDDKIPGPDDWEKLVAVREDQFFYMGDYIQLDGKLHEIRFDCVYHGDLEEDKKKRRRRK
ncbi:MAG: hypothetical protein IJO55_01320 [Lachnospiraceae bacterium]|nr:hypothetical protein [Lachnospiraceae bacterium]MBQ6856351.1 hypothetical protein [Lachnospiraceae bacterium]